jgi:hypothetical protein
LPQQGQNCGSYASAWTSTQKHTDGGNDSKSHTWTKVQLGLVSASEIVHQLVFRRTIRETFFPEAIMDVAVLRSALAGTNGATNEELSAQPARPTLRVRTHVPARHRPNNDEE